jgi:GNAT superfamily N-acetyltransferase
VARVRVRRAGGADLEALTRLWLELTEHHADFEPLYALRPDALPEVRRLLEAQLGSPDSALFLAESGDSAAGFASVYVAHAPPIHPEQVRGEIGDLYVAPGFRRSGLGSALVERSVDWLRERNVLRVEVRVVTGNREGQAFWRAQGYRDFIDVLHRRL